MAISGATIWEVRTGGATTNGGGYHSGGGGTDWSQQNAAQYALTGLASAGAGNTILSAAAATDMVGNIAQAISGTNVTPGFYEVLSVSVGVSITFGTNNAGTSVATGVAASMVLNIGGAMSGPEDANSGYQPGNMVFIQSGTYTKTTTRTITAAGSITGGELAFVGYPSGGSRTDQDVVEASMPVLTTATNSIAKLTLNAANRTRWRNIKVTDTAATRGEGFRPVTGNSVGVVFENCIADGCLNGWASSASFSRTIYSRCVARNCTASGFTAAVSSGQYYDCVASANAGPGFSIPSGTPGSSYYNCISYGNTGANGNGFVNSNTTTDSADFNVYRNCAAYNNSQNGWRFAFTTGDNQGMMFDNCISEANAAFGVSCATAGIMDGTVGNSAFPRVRNFAYYNNTSGATQNFRAGEGQITGSSSFFTNAAGADFSLNSTASAGALLRGLGYPTEIGVKGSTTATFPNVGASDPQATAASGGVILGG